MATIDTIANEAYQRHLLKGAEVAPVAVEQKVDSLVKRPPVTEVPEPEVETGKNVIMRFIDALTNDVYDSSILERAQKEPSTDVQMGSDKMYGRYKTPLHVFQAMNRDVDPDSAEMYVRETPSLDYLNMLDIDAREEEMGLQEYRRMIAGDSEFSFPTEARQVSSKIKIPKFTESEDPEVIIKDAPDADIVLDEPVEVTEEGLMDDPRSKRPKARPEVETGDTTDFNFKDTSIKLVSDLMKDFDLTKTQAAALVGNLAWESDNYQGMQEYEPAVKGSRGGYGFAQWTGTRRRMFEEWSKENELDPNSYEANYGFLKFELSSPNNEIGNMGVNTIKKLKDTKDLDTATSVVMKEYLRPGIPHEEKRKKRSSQVLDLI